MGSFKKIKVAVFWKYLLKRSEEEAYLNPLSANPTKWRNPLKQFVGNSRRIVWVGFSILWGGRLKG